MFTHIRRHQKWLWLFISGAVIISFVWYFNPHQQYGGGGAVTGGDTAVVGTMYGEPISRKTFNNAYREAMLQILFSYGDWPDSQMARQFGIDLNREARNRMLLMRKVDEYNIHVSDKAAADWIIQAFQDRETKTFRGEVYERLISQELPQRGLNRADFERFARNQVAIQHLAAVVGAPGKLVTPQEAAYQYRNENRKVEAKVALFNATNFLAQVPMTPEAIGQFYTNRMAAYREPERVQLSYVAFPVTNYLAAAREKLAAEPDLTNRIEMLYAQRGSNFYTDENDQPMTPEAAKARIYQEALDEVAIVEARRDAINLALALEQQLEKTPPSPASENPAQPLETVAAEQGLQVQTTSPFTQFEGPSELNLPAQFNRSAFMLSAEEPVLLDPIVAEDAVYVISFRNRVPSRLQPFADIEQRVTEEYRRIESYRLAREAASQFRDRAAEAVASGQPFEAPAEEAGAQVLDLQPFSREDRFIEGLPPQVDASSIITPAFQAAPGKVAEVANTRDGAVVVYVEQVIPVSEEEVQRALPEYMTEIRRRGASQAFDNWFRNEMELARITMAGDGQSTDLQSSF